MWLVLPSFMSGKLPVIPHCLVSHFHKTDTKTQQILINIDPWRKVLLARRVCYLARARYVNTRHKVKVKLCSYVQQLPLVAFCQSNILGFCSISFFAFLIISLDKVEVIFYSLGTTRSKLCRIVQCDLTLAILLSLYHVRHFFQQQ